MVSRNAWTKIVFRILLICVALAIVFGIEKFSIVNKSIKLDIQNREIDLQIISGIKKQKEIIYDDGNRVLIIPHHIVANEIIAEGISKLQSQKNKTVFIISPDHYKRCGSFACTADIKFETYFGNIKTNSNVSSELIKNKNIFYSTELFRNEHGINAIVPFVKYYLPNSQIVPIVIRANTIVEKDKLEDVYQTIKKSIFREDAMLIISSDFSHYLNLSQANANDEKTKEIFLNGKSEDLIDLKNPDYSDCPNCLYIAKRLSEDLKTQKCTMLNHSNSAIVLNDSGVKETTSYFSFVCKK